jgi:hypothetical protein
LACFFSAKAKFGAKSFYGGRPKPGLIAVNAAAAGRPDYHRQHEPQATDGFWDERSRHGELRA